MGKPPYGVVLSISTLLGIAVAGCATKNPPLMFGDSTTYGIRLGNDTATGGASVSLGMKAQSIALVPITYNASNGWATTITAEVGEMSDAMSVFAVFGSEAPATESGSAQKVGLGQMFVTGLAAQTVTEGYICRAQGSDCKVDDAKADLLAKNAVATANAAAAQARAAAIDARDAAASANATANVSRSAEPTQQIASVERGAEKIYDPEAGPYQRPLVFLRTDVFGLDIGGALAEKGLQFVLGYNNRNLAFIPTYSVGANKQVGTILSCGSTCSDSTGRKVDALSVFGQFRANTQTSTLGYELDRFFATGVAARHLSTAAKVGIATTPTPPQKPASSVAAKQ